MRNAIAAIITMVALFFVTNEAFAMKGELYGANRLLSSRTLCVAQDKYGFIWVGTECGLNRFDGYHFVSYKHSGKILVHLPE